MNQKYDFALSGEAARFLLGSKARVRAKAEDVFDRLAADPFTEADFTEKAPSGRNYHVKIYGDMVITYWVDHAEREIRIIRCEVV